MTDPKTPPDDPDDKETRLLAPSSQFTPEAQRALSEAQVRRTAQAAAEKARAEEIGGRKGPDPVRFGDWEVGGIASDF